MRTGGHLVQRIRERMAALGLSQRALARRAGVSHSAVSRLLSGRARPTAGLLRALAAPLGLPAEVLLRDAGLLGGASEPPPPTAQRGGPSGEGPADLWQALRALGVEPAPPGLVARVAERLERLRAYAGTEEARAAVREGLERKLAALGAQGPVVERLRELARVYLDDATPAAARAAAGSGVLYFLLAVDAIDDFVFPVGYLDDAVAVALAAAEVGRLLRGRPRRPDGPG